MIIKAAASDRESEKRRQHRKSKEHRGRVWPSLITVVVKYTTEKAVLPDQTQEGKPLQRNDTKAS